MVDLIRRDTNIVTDLYTLAPNKKPSITLAKLEKTPNSNKATRLPRKPATPKLRDSNRHPTLAHHKSKNPQAKKINDNSKSLVPHKQKEAICLPGDNKPNPINITSPYGSQDSRPDNSKALVSHEHKEAICLPGDDSNTIDLVPVEQKTTNGLENNIKINQTNTNQEYPSANATKTSTPAEIHDSWIDDLLDYILPATHKL